MNAAVAYLLFVVVSVAALLALLAYGWRHRQVAGGGRFAVLVLAAVAWCVLIAGGATATPSAARILLGFKYGTIAVTSVAAFLTVAHHVGRLTRPGRLQMTAFFVVPLACALLSLDNGLGMITSVTFVRDGGLTYITAIAFGPVYWIFTGYLYTLTLWAVGWLVFAGRGRAPLLHAQAGPLALGLLAPLLCNTLLITGITPRRYDPMPLGLVASATAFWWAMFRHRMFDLVPIAREILADSMRDGFIVVDAHGRVIDLNQPVAVLLGTPAETVIGRPVASLFAAGEPLAETLATLATGTSTVQHGERFFEVSITPISDIAPPAPRLIQLQDVSERWRWQNEQARLIAELRSALTQVKTLQGLLPICAVCKKIRDDSGDWQPVEQYIHSRTHVRFSHGMCPECIEHWYSDVGTPTNNT